MSGVTLVDCGEPFQTPILGQISTLGQFCFFARTARPRRNLRRIRVRGLCPFVLLANSLSIFITTHYSIHNWFWQNLCEMASGPDEVLTAAGFLVMRLGTTEG